MDFKYVLSDFFGIRNLSNLNGLNNLSGLNDLDSLILSKNLLNIGFSVVVLRSAAAERSYQMFNLGTPDK